MVERAYVPSRSYDCELIIKDVDYSSSPREVASVKVISSLISYWTVVQITVLVGPGDIILDGIHGQDPIKLKIRLQNEEGNMLDEVNMELMYLSSALDMPIKDSKEQEAQKDRVAYSFVTVSRPAFKTMTSLVNEVYEAKSPKEIVESMASDVGASIEYDSEDANTNQIPQICIPPTTLYQAIKFMDMGYGLFNGISSIYCQYDNKIYVRNLTKKMKKSQIFTAYLWSMDSSEDEKKSQKELDGKLFMTQYPVMNNYRGNSVTSILSKQLVHITCPNDKLYETIEQDIVDLSKSYGLIYKGSEIPIDSNIESRKKYFIEHTGGEGSGYFATAMISKKIAELATINITLDRNLIVSVLLNVGEVVMFDTDNEVYRDLTGKYILKSSEITFSRSKTKTDMTVSARLQLTRTNKTI